MTIFGFTADEFLAFGMCLIEGKYVYFQSPSAVKNRLTSKQ